MFHMHECSLCSHREEVTGERRGSRAAAVPFHLTPFSSRFCHWEGACCVLGQRQRTRGGSDKYEIPFRHLLVNSFPAAHSDVLCGFHLRMDYGPLVLNP